MLAEPRRSPFDVGAIRPFDAPANPLGNDLDVDESNGPAIWTPEELPMKNGRFSPLVVMYMGRRNAGKSYSMTVQSRLMQKRHRFHQTGFKLAANYIMRFADFSGQHIYDEIITFPDWFRDQYLAMDEIQGQVSNRRAMNKGTLNFGIMLSMIRKRRVEPLFTTQFPQTIDRLTLMQTDLFVEVRTRQRMHTIELLCHDYWGQWTGNNHSKQWPPRSWEADWAVQIHVDNPAWYFSQYETDEVIAAQTLDAAQREALIDKEYELRRWQEQVPMEEAQEAKARIEDNHGLSAREVVEKTYASLEELLGAYPDTFTLSKFTADAKDMGLAASSMTQQETGELLELLGCEVVKQGRVTNVIKPGAPQ